MERRYLDLGEQAFLLINGPLVLLNLTANVFYAYCLIFPPCHRYKLKQPLKMLLGFLVWSSIAFLVHLSFTYGALTEPKISEASAVSWMIVLCNVHSSITCSVWLTFYYYIQIAPSQRALLIWFKRNIRPSICTAFLLEKIFILFSGAMNAANVVLRTSRGFADNNGTQTEHCRDDLHITSLVTFYIVKLHILGCLSIMTVSNFSTVHYLHRHIKSVAQGGLFTPRIQSQLRVTISGVFQGVLFLLYGTFYFIDSFTYRFSSHFYLGAWVSLTFTSLYISGTTVNLGIGQTIFRQRAADVWKALTALCGAGMVSNDVKTHTSQ